VKAQAARTPVLSTRLLRLCRLLVACSLRGGAVDEACRGVERGEAVPERTEQLVLVGDKELNQPQV